MSLYYCFNDRPVDVALNVIIDAGIYNTKVNRSVNSSIHMCIAAMIAYREGYITNEESDKVTASILDFIGSDDLTMRQFLHSIGANPENLEQACLHLYRNWNSRYEILNDILELVKLREGVH
jgi:hypothetical protein